MADALCLWGDHCLAKELARRKNCLLSLNACMRCCLVQHAKLLCLKVLIYKSDSVIDPERWVHYLLLVISVPLCQTSCPLRTVHLVEEGSGSLLGRLSKDAGTPSTECSLTNSWKALKSLSMGRFTWMKNPTLLIQALPFRWNRHWKDMGHLNTLKERYIHTAHGKYFWAASNFYANTNLFI